MPEFDYQGAKQAGWNDEEITEFITKENKKGSNLYIKSIQKPDAISAFSSGFGKSLTSTVKTGLVLPGRIGEIIPQEIKAVAQKIPPIKAFGGAVEQAKKLGEKIPKEAVTPTPEEKAGFISGEIAQFLVPLPLGKGKAGEALIKGGEKIIKSVIKPVQADIRAGFKIENITKHDVGGNLQDILKKSSEKIKKNVELLRNKIGQSKERGNVDEIVKETVEELNKKGLSQFGDITSVEKAINNLKNEVKISKKRGLITKNGEVSIPDLQVIKQSSGLRGAWDYGKPDRDAKALESVYNEFYLKAKKAIEIKSPKGVEEINKALHELIPIQQAVIRRIPVAERQNPLSLTDVIALGTTFTNPKASALFIVNRLLKSGRVGEIITKAGKALK